MYKTAAIHTLAQCILLLAFLTASDISSAASLEEQYFNRRDDFIRQLEREAAPVDDRAALTELEQILTALIGPIKIEGFPKQGRINLLTLRKVMGFGQLDGLRFDSGQDSLIVTTEHLLSRYLTEHPELPKDVRGLAQNSDFYRLAFLADAGVTSYAELPVKSTDGRSFVHAFLGVTAQETGPFRPEDLFIFARHDNKVLLASSPAAAQITDIPQCQKDWLKFAEKRSTAYARYRSSLLTDQKAFDDSLRYANQGFAAYLRCYAKEAPNQPFFLPLQEQAQSTVNRLLRE